MEGTFVWLKDVKKMNNGWSGYNRFSYVNFSEDFLGFWAIVGEYLNCVKNDLIQLCGSEKLNIGH